MGGTSFSPTYDASGNDVSTVSDTTRVVWGPSGGGASAVFPKPPYQQGLTPADGARDVPDVALLADPGAPGVFFGDDPALSGSAVINCCLGGTSLSAPVFAGFAKLIEQQLGPAWATSTPRSIRLRAAAVRAPMAFATSPAAPTPSMA